MKMDADEKELLDSVERGEWKSAKGGKRERARYSRYAKATFRKDRRLNIRLSSKDLEAIQKRALVAVSDVDREPATQVRDRAAQRDLRSGLGGFAQGFRLSTIFGFRSTSSRFKRPRIARVGSCRL
jgi:predicted DNA binding CopG/RHH family protein